MATRSNEVIDKALNGVMAGGRIPGLAAAAADHDGVIYHSAFGRLDSGQPQPVTADSVFRIASMTKAITAAAAMQLVEQGKIGLDQPAREILPFLAETKVLDGFDGNGTPILRAPRGEITLRRLLTHTAGFVYDTWNENLNRYAKVTGLLAARTGKLAALTAPLGFDPGVRWEYGINIDIAGRMVDVVSGLDLETYMQRNLFTPLRMVDTSFIQRPDWDSRLLAVHARQTDGTLKPLAAPAAPTGPDETREFYPGGGGLFSTVGDYLRFLQALMHGGVLDGQRVLRAETVTLMGQNHMDALNVLPMKSFIAHLSNDVALFPGNPSKWGLSFLINTQDVAGGRSAGSLAWAGLNNTYYWLDPHRQVAGVLMTQILPFADRAVLDALDAFEAAVYQTL